MATNDSLSDAKELQSKHKRALCRLEREAKNPKSMTVTELLSEHIRFMLDEAVALLRDYMSNTISFKNLQSHGNLAI